MSEFYNNVKTLWQTSFRNKWKMDKMDFMTTKIFYDNR